MKNYINVSTVLFVFMFFAFSFSACKKDSNTNMPTNILPTPISNIVSQSMIDSLRAAGTTVNIGTTPNIVNGIYLMQPDSCIYDNSPGNFAGTLFADYKFKFTNQNNTLFTIDVEQKNLVSNVLNATPAFTYISGNGNDFSIFILRTISPGGIAVQQFNILSGTLTASGVQNLQNTLYLRSKINDVGNTLPPAGTIRLFVTGGSGLASTSTTF